MNVQYVLLLRVAKRQSAAASPPDRYGQLYGRSENFFGGKFFGGVQDLKPARGVCALPPRAPARLRRERTAVCRSEGLGSTR